MKTGAGKEFEKIIYLVSDASSEAGELRCSERCRNERQRLLDSRSDKAVSLRTFTSKVLKKEAAISTKPVL